MERFKVVLFFAICFAFSACTNSGTINKNIEYWETYDIVELTDSMRYNVEHSNDSTCQQWPKIMQDLLKVMGRDSYMKDFEGLRISNMPFSELLTTNLEDTLRVNNALSAFAKYFPKDLVLCWESPLGEDNGQISLLSLKKSNVDGCFMNITSVKNYEITEFNTNYYLSVELEDIDAQRFAELTKKSIGRNIACKIDNKVYSNTHVNSQITGGKTFLFVSRNRIKVETFKDLYLK